MLLEAEMTLRERVLMGTLTTPRKIQDFLDLIEYEPEYFNRCPLRVFRERRGHCLDGALFGAAALRRLGFRPIVVDLLPEPNMDDDHVLAVYRKNGHYGAVAKSNFVGLRYREPVFRDLRELVMSYFEDYFNSFGRKTLRAYTKPLDLRPYDAQSWETRDETCDRIEQHFKDLPTIAILTPAMIRSLAPVDRRTLDAALHGANPDGLYKPGIA
jgi:hypothetical protein